jgi:hypothetical protein
VKLRLCSGSHASSAAGSGTIDSPRGLGSPEDEPREPDRVRATASRARDSEPEVAPTSEPVRRVRLPEVLPACRCGTDVLDLALRTYQVSHPASRTQAVVSLL